MKKYRYHIIIGAALLLLSWSNLSRYCRHQRINWKFRLSSFQANLSPPMADTVTYVYKDDPDIEDISISADSSTHGTASGYPKPDLKALAEAMVRMDSADKAKPLTWEMLKDVKYKKIYNAEYDQYFDHPIFGDKLKALDGQKVYIKGYIIPLELNVYALSKYPYAACFFCGGAGPETISGLTFAKTPRRFKTDEFLTLQGVFRLNKTDVNNFMYQLYAVEAEK